MRLHAPIMYPHSQPSVRFKVSPPQKTQLASQQLQQLSFDALAGLMQRSPSFSAVPLDSVILSARLKQTQDIARFGDAPPLPAYLYVVHELSRFGADLFRKFLNLAKQASYRNLR